jgi:hypothetical protein
MQCFLYCSCIESYSGGVNMYDHDDINDGECHPYVFNHAIQLNGWGTDENGTDYWIGRNSWGTYWGELCWHVRVLNDDKHPPMGVCVPWS